MKVGSLVRIEYRWDWIKMGVVTSIISAKQVEVLWNDGEVRAINITPRLEILCK